MDANDVPVAHRTRSRYRKRKALLVEGLPRVRKDKSVGKKAGSVAAAAGASFKENVAPNPRVTKSGMDKESSKSIPTTVPNDDEQPKEPTVVVQPASELEPLKDLKVETETLLTMISCSDWLDQYEATTLYRRFVNYHPKEIKKYLGAHMAKIFRFLQDGVESLRSAQSRNTLLAVGEMFENVPSDDIEIFIAGKISGILDSIVIKSSNDKRFIATTGEDALRKIVASVPCSEVLIGLLSHSKSKSPKVLLVISKYSSVLLKGIVQSKHGDAAILSGNVDEIITKLALIESGRSVEAKKYAHESFRAIYRGLGKESFGKAMERVLSPAETSRILKMIEKNPNTKAMRKPTIKEIMAKKRRELEASKTQS
mmetsp:Transcript_19943/g.32859  ORF Transcript_19943/g.32859 Transcript_19943/m.32859 type:complete len:369 (+) Transcript_19943:224-1330(+)|eukprot:CAMPEP_0203790884 /NCGR_PEP_ID=MMETSP0100_2-20121128/4304_1 /ASSEMBLY_ACC=CAM_ASM_000210 /TAXON_ID=96639 /ORGANISM=" , Strain NY0313808BC1" /LENGTH=368 /DNA_ID=CAMNT_0050694095 /DNA_START=141 /DNA_END=1247 /DNA_ORIENTATION=-